MKKIEFTSDRKMMSVVVKNVKNNKCYVFSKGADMSMIKRLREQDKYSRTTSFVNEFARKGYRTLVFGMKEIDQKPEYTDEEVESNLTLLGVTGVEDELQDDIKKCIQDFNEAGIHFWMLTGDKGETAEEIGYSCGMFSKDNFK